MMSKEVSSSGKNRRNLGLHGVGDARKNGFDLSGPWIYHLKNSHQLIIAAGITVISRRTQLPRLTGCFCHFFSFNHRRRAFCPRNVIWAMENKKQAHSK